jgi:dipeptidyl aminopeptidase/acylaminoacyl peptidase
MPNDPDNVIVESDGLGLERDLFRYNVRTGEAARMLRLSENDIDVQVDGAGRLLARTRGGSDSGGVFIATDLRNPDTNQWEEHFKSYVKTRDVVEVLRRGVAPGTVVLRSNIGREMTALFEYDVKSRKIVSTLFEHKYFDAVNARRLTDGDATEADGFDAFVYEGPYGAESHWINPKFEAVVKGVAQSLGINEVKQALVDVASGARAEVPMFDGAQIAITGFHAGDTPTYLVRVSGLAYPTEHYMLRGNRLTLLAKEYPQIDRRALGKAEFVYYKARDGLNIPAILTRPNPALCGPGPYAAVVHPHGGPWARDNMLYDRSSWVPMLVSRCRVVLQPQFRGSADWGRTLWVAGDAQWGQKMQDDKDDGAKWLIDEKLVDPKRIAMFGFSYGGYAAFAAAVRPNGLYKCSIAGAGVSDIERIWARFYTNPYFRERQEPTVRGLSPLTAADKIQIPMMVYHGDRDLIVPLEQSEFFVKKAASAQHKVEYHMLKDYGHGPAWTRAINAQQLSLIDQYLSKGCAGGL